MNIDIRYAQLLCVFHSLPSTTAFVVNAKNNKVRPVTHSSVMRLIRTLEMYPCRAGTHLYLVIIRPVGIFVVPILRRGVWQNPNEGTIIVPESALTPPYCGGNELIKLSIPADKEQNIFFFIQHRSQKIFQTFLHLYAILNLSVSKETDRENLHWALSPQSCFLLQSLTYGYYIFAHYFSQALTISSGTSNVEKV